MTPKNEQFNFTEKLQNEKSTSLFCTMLHYSHVQVQVQVKNLVVPHYCKNAGALQLSHKNDV